MKCLVDNQLPPSLARFLTERGVDSQHVVDVGMEEASDPAIWRYAAQQNRVLISKDDDFPEPRVEGSWN